MHRSSIKCFAEASRIGGSQQPYSTAARNVASTSRPRGKFVVPLPRRPPPPLGEAENQVLEALAGRAIRVMAKGQNKRGYNHQKKQGGLLGKAEKAVKAMSKQQTLLSAKKMAIMSDNTMSVEEEAKDEEDFMARKGLVPGCFVELRRDATTSHAVIVAMSSSEGRQVMHSFTSSGDIWPHRITDVVFSIPNFASKEIVSSCGTGNITDNEHEIAARVKVLKLMRELEREVDTKYPSISQQLSVVYDQFKSPDPLAWAELSTSQAARAIGESSQIARFCVHKFLMKRPEHFVAHTQNFLATHSFWVRPLTDVEDLKAINTMISQQDPSFLGFVKKARGLISAYRARPQTSSYGPPTRGDILATFNDDELRFVQFLERSLRTRRSTQKDPYTVPVATILKTIGMYNNETVDGHISHKLLVEMGVLPPWDDPLIRDMQLVLMSSPGDAKKRAKSTVPASHSSQVLRPDEFYPHDPVADVRHDFGDMPVYVIDDAGAQELDDGLSVERIPSEPNSHWVHAHIADPTALIHPDHKLANHARHVLTTMYFVHQTIPMLPKELMYNGMSLGSGGPQGEPQKVLTFSFKVNEHGKIEDYKVRAGVVRNVHVVRYDEVNEALGAKGGKARYPFGNPPPELPLRAEITPSMTEDLRVLDKIAVSQALERVRSLKAVSWGMPGAHIGMPTTPPSYDVDPSRSYEFRGFPSLTYSVENYTELEFGARRLVAEFMKSAGRVASMFCRDHNIPMIRRHVPPLVAESPDALDQLLTKLDDRGYSNYVDILKAGVVAPAAEYTLQPKGHSQLGIPDGEGYMKVTSPLRRYGDMVAHWQIKHALMAPLTGSTKPLFSTDWMKNFAVEFGLKENRLSSLGKKHQNFWALSFIEQWMRRPQEQRAGQHDPLESLTGYLISGAKLDLISGQYIAHAIVPELGVKGTLSGFGREMAANIGDPVNLKIAKIHRGNMPMLSFHLRK